MPWSQCAGVSSNYIELQKKKKKNKWERWLTKRFLRHHKMVNILAIFNRVLYFVNEHIQNFSRFTTQKSPQTKNI